MERREEKGAGILGKVLRIVAKVFAAIILIVVALAAATGISPIYDFKEPAPFAGDSIYNPYKDLDTANCWKRANFHTHTRVEGIMNECDHSPSEVLEYYEKLGYDIVTFSNHNKLTTNPKGEEYQANAYEHGYNLFKYHKLTYGVDEEWGFDHIFPIFASQKQFQLIQLLGDADIVQINHPLRTPTLSKEQLERLCGYKLIELDSGKSTENEYWDWALSAGRYSFGVANDDLHYPDRTHRIARRCNFLCTPSARYKDILATLNSGCFYSMRVPDYGKGNWEVKCEKNKSLPYIKDISLNGNVISILLSEPAKTIKVVGENHTTLSSAEECSSMEYAMKESDPYARIIAYFPNGEVIYTNPFARYDASLQTSPFDDYLPQVNIILTTLFNLLLLLICVADGYIFYKYIIKR